MSTPRPARRGSLAFRLSAVGCAVAGLAIVAWLLQRSENPDRRADDGSAAKYAATPRPPRPSPAAEGYVGSQQCRECHEEYWRDFQSHPMAHSIDVVPAALDMETYGPATEFRPPRDRTYRVERDGSRVSHHEVLTDGDGAVLYEQSVDVGFTLGSGTRGRSYMFLRDGVLMQSPIAWYTTLNKWDLSPGYIGNLHHPRFDRRIRDRCMACHAGHIEHLPGRGDQYLDPPFSELAIGCERCHGPGEAHVRKQRDDPSAELPDATIVNPSRLSRAARESVCYQCHLHGEPAIPRYGRTYRDFRPGQTTEEVWTSFVQRSDLRENDTRPLTSHVAQMRASQCYVGSKGEFGCTSCHEPHSSPQPSEKEAYYEQKCMACHAEQGCKLPAQQRLTAPAAGSCIHCHMPRLSVLDASHVAQTDHRVVRRPRAQSAGDVALGASLSWEIFDNGESRLEPWELDRAYGMAALEAFSKSNNRPMLSEGIRRLEPLLDLLPDDVPLLEKLAGARFAEGQFDASRELWDRILAIEPQHERALMTLVMIGLKTNEVPQALPFAERLIEVNRWSPPYYAYLTELHMRQANYAAAIEAAERCLELDPTQTETRISLADALEKLGRTAESVSQRELAVKIGNRLAALAQEAMPAAQSSAPVSQPAAGSP